MFNSSNIQVYRRLVLTAYKYIEVGLLEDLTLEMVGCNHAHDRGNMLAVGNCKKGVFLSPRLNEAL